MWNNIATLAEQGQNTRQSLQNKEAVVGGAISPEK